MTTSLSVVIQHVKYLSACLSVDSEHHPSLSLCMIVNRSVSIQQSLQNTITVHLHLQNLSLQYSLSLFCVFTMTFQMTAWDRQSWWSIHCPLHHRQSECANMSGTNWCKLCTRSTTHGEGGGSTTGMLYHLMPMSENWILVPRQSVCNQFADLRI